MAEIKAGNLKLSSNPKMHDLPQMCLKCGVTWYYTGHYCVVENAPDKAFKRAVQGYYDGE